MIESRSKSLRAVLLAFAAALSVTVTPAVAADAAAQAVNAVPASEATWKSIDTNLQQLEALIAAGKLDDPGHSAYDIANAVKTLPGQSGSLPADKLALVKGSVKVVGSYVSKVDKAGESNNKAGGRLQPERAEGHAQFAARHLLRSESQIVRAHKGWRHDRRSLSPVRSNVPA